MRRRGEGEERGKRGGETTRTTVWRTLRRVQERELGMSRRRPRRGTVKVTER